MERGQNTDPLIALKSLASNKDVWNPMPLDAPVTIACFLPTALLLDLMFCMALNYEA
jgi:hypothetical protein